MQTKFKILQRRFPKKINPDDGGFRIFYCRTSDSQLLTNDGYFSIKGVYPTLMPDKEYTLQLGLISQDKWGYTYCVDQALDFESGQLSYEESFAILRDCSTSDTICYNILDAYPNFIDLVLNGKDDEIDLKQIKGVGKKYFASYKQTLLSNYRGVSLSAKLAKYQVTAKEGNILMDKYDTVENVLEKFKECPYEILIGGLNRSFDTMDFFILQDRPELIDSYQRCVYAVREAIKNPFMYEGNTRVDANTIVKYIPKECSHHVVEAVKNDPLFYYDEQSKTVAWKEVYNQECNITNKIEKLLENYDSEKFDWDEIDTKQYEQEWLTEDQNRILSVVKENNIALLTGYSGAGKSSALKALTDMLVNLDISFLLLAPTGKAAKRITETTGHPASTIHKAVFNIGDMNFLEQVIIVDETSMIGIDLANMLFNHIGEYHKVIFVGDFAQLPSISYGNFFMDIINSGRIPQVNLTKVFRYADSPVATIATQCRQGETYIDHGELTANFINKDNLKDYTFIHNNGTLKQITDSYQQLLDEGYTQDDIVILSPFNVGEQGTYVVNEAIQQMLFPGNKPQVSYNKGRYPINFMIGSRVINIKNNYNVCTVQQYNHNLECETTGLDEDFKQDKNFIANGDVGVITDIDDDGNMFIKFSELEVVYTKNDCRLLLLGYCVTVHKFQGSESKAVIFASNAEHKRMLNRQLLYVAITRCKQRLIEIGDENIIHDALQINTIISRNTWLKQLLNNS